VFHVPAYELTQPPLSRLSSWERRSSHVPLTAPGTVASAQVEGDKKGDAEISLPLHGDEENRPIDVSSVTLAFTQFQDFFFSLIHIA
jgi:hypothetical protein